MDGYTFMIERNRRLIEHEARTAWQRSRDSSAEEVRQADTEAEADIRKLYEELEGCGRGANAAPLHQK